jgi:riboflavin kinase / FMN adenylyltransferase
MRIVNDWHDLAPEHRGAAVALAEFDGVHRGHQQVLANAASAARRLRAPMGVVSFEPDPRRWRFPWAEPARLMNLGQQARVLAGYGADIFYVLPFDAQMADMGGEGFARDVLAAGLGVRHVAVAASGVGQDEALVRYGETHRFSVSVARRSGPGRSEQSSSDAIRAALKAGRPDLAAEIMGRPFALQGVVIEGQQLGRKLGFPTANVSAGDYLRPRLGIYATRSRLDDGREFPGVANFGVNPTTGIVDARLEVCLFDFDEDIYGRTLETDLIAFLRPELRFNSLAALIEQMGKDADDARAILNGEFRRTASQR